MFHFFLKFFSFLLPLLLLLYSNNNSTKPLSPKPISNLEIMAGQEKLLSPSFWLKDDLKDNEIILSGAEVALINKRTLRQGHLLNPINLGKTLNAQQVRGYLEEDLKVQRKYIKYTLDGTRKRDPEFNDYLKNKIDLAAIQGVKRIFVKYAVTVNNVNLRFFPTQEVYVRKKQDTHFDIMMKTHLNLDEPVAILHTSKDKEWYYVESKYARGWAQRKDLALLSYEAIKKYQGESKPLTTISVSSKVYSKEDKEVIPPLTIPMGVSLRLGKEQVNGQVEKDKIKGKINDAFSSKLTILLPTKKAKAEEMELREFLIDRKDVHLGKLPLTKKNLIQQSFKFLDVAYEWGGGAVNVDCSLFLLRVFSSMGINLPRSSTGQKKVFSQKGFNQATNNFTDSFIDEPKNFLPQISFLAKPTHIMLFLGKYESRDYFIHSLWSFNDKNNQEMLVRSVIVSSDALGKNSNKKSLKEKTTFRGSLGL